LRSKIRRRTQPQPPLYYGPTDIPSQEVIDIVASTISTDFSQLTGQIGGAQLITRSTVAVTTASLANNAVENGVIVLGKSSLVSRFVGTAKSRIRLYSTAAYRTADAARVPGIDPIGEHGVMLDIVLPTGILSWDLSPLSLVTNDDVAPVANIYYAIQNLSGAAAAITATLTRILLEA
jgi:hypothetical protein